jgi:hypothetical protein
MDGWIDTTEYSDKSSDASSTMHIYVELEAKYYGVPVLIMIQR